MLPRMACPASLPCLFCPVCSLLKEKRIKAGAHMKQLSQKMRQQRLQVGGGGLQCCVLWGGSGQGSCQACSTCHALGSLHPSVPARHPPDPSLTPPVQMQRLRMNALQVADRIKKHMGGGVRMLPLEMERNVKDLASGVEQLVDKVVSGGC